MYVIIVGAGSIGSQVLELAVTAGHEVVVVESDPVVADQVGRDYDCLVLNADATEKETLEDAGADQADAIISTTDQDAVNIMVMLLAEELEIPSLVSVVHNPDHMALFRKLGVNVLENPQRLIAEYLFRAVQRPSVKDYMQLAGGAEVVEITVIEDAPLAGVSLETAAERDLLDEGVLVIAIERDDEVVLPKGATVLEPGDLVTVFSLAGVSDELMRTLTGEAV